ncbi:MAG: ABC transporter permease [Candidatus Glassbacteria bacterium]
MKVVRAIIRKEFLQVFRNPFMLRIIFVIPIVQLFVLGYAITFDITNISLVVRDSDRSQTSRLLVEKIQASGRFRIRAYEPDQQRLKWYFDNAAAQVSLAIPRDFEADLANGRNPALQILVDGVDSNTGIVANGYIQQIVAETMSQLERNHPAPQMKAPAGAGRIEPKVRVWYNPDLESRNYMLPGIVAILVMMTTVLLTSTGIVREREIGTLEQLSVTPVRKWELLLGKTIPFAVLGFFLLLLALTVVAAWYRIPMEGSLGLLLFLGFLFVLCNLSVGLLISTLSSTQQEAFLLAFFFIIFAILTSGLFAPIHNMPQYIQYMTYLNPVRYFMEVVRGIYLKGSSFAYLWHQGAALLVWGLAAFWFASLRFRKQVS